MNQPSATVDKNRFLTALLDEQCEGYALAREFYTDASIFEQDIKSYWNNSWIWVGHVCQIPQSGDFFLFNYANESVLITRDNDGQIGAFQNVCRHRGSRVCLQNAGRKKVFSCPYHGWTYELNGALRAARAMDKNFNKQEHGLLPLHVEVFQGLIFVNAAQNPAKLDAGLSKIAPLSAPYELERMKIAHEASYPVAANWKLALENYMECYHCAPAHLEYSKSHSLKDPTSITEEMTKRIDRQINEAGLKGGSVSIYGSEGQPVDVNFYLERYPLYDGFQTGSKSGELMAPLLGKLKSPVGAAMDLQIGILNNLLIYSDHVVGYRFVPRNIQETDIQVVWYVHEDAEVEKNYSHEELTWLWAVTSLDDERIIRHNQEGVNSHHFKPGPLSEMEWGIRAFYSSYLNHLQQAMRNQEYVK